MLDLALSLESIAATGGTGAGAAPPALATPVFTWLSGPDEFDPRFHMTELEEGDEWEIRVDDDPAYGSLYGSDTGTVSAMEASDGELEADGIPTLDYDTTYYGSGRYRRGGIWSDWSANDSQTMDPEPVATPTTWNPSAKSNFIILSGSDLIATGTNGVGAQMPVLGTNGKATGKKRFEVVIDPDGTFSNAGWGFSNVLPANFTNPGAGTNGIFRNLNGVVTYGGATLATETSHETTAAVVCGGIVDVDNDKVWFTLGGVLTTAGNPATGTGGYSVPGIGTFFAMFVAQDDDIATLRRLNSEITGPAYAGFTGWDD